MNVSSRRAKRGSACTSIASRCASASLRARSSCAAGSRADEDVAQAAGLERASRAAPRAAARSRARTSPARTGTARRARPSAARRAAWSRMRSQPDRPTRARWCSADRWLRSRRPFIPSGGSATISTRGGGSIPSGSSPPRDQHDAEALREPVAQRVRAHQVPEARPSAGSRRAARASQQLRTQPGEEVCAHPAHGGQRHPCEQRGRRVPGERLAVDRAVAVEERLRRRSRSRARWRRPARGRPRPARSRGARGRAAPRARRRAAPRCPRFASPWIVTGSVSGGSPSRSTQPPRRIAARRAARVAITSAAVASRAAIEPRSKAGLSCQRPQRPCPAVAERRGLSRRRAGTAAGVSRGSCRARTGPGCGRASASIVRTPSWSARMRGTRTVVLVGEGAQAAAFAVAALDLARTRRPASRSRTARRAQATRRPGERAGERFELAVVRERDTARRRPRGRERRRCGRCGRPRTSSARRPDSGRRRAGCRRRGT